MKNIKHIKIVLIKQIFLNRFCFFGFSDKASTTDFASSDFPTKPRQLILLLRVFRQSPDSWFCFFGFSDKAPTTDFASSDFPVKPRQLILLLRVFRQSPDDWFCFFGFSGKAPTAVFASSEIPVKPRQQFLLHPAAKWKHFYCFYFTVK